MPKNANKLAGQRLKIAREAYGFTQEDLYYKLKNWQKNVNISDAKRIGVWEREGVPHKKIALVAECFNFEPSYFTDPALNNDDFCHKVLLRKSDSKAVIDQDDTNIYEGRLIPIKEIVKGLQLLKESGKHNNNAEIIHARGLEYQNDDEYDHAILDYDKAIEIEPNYAEAFLNRSICHAIKGNFEQAFADLDASIKIRKVEAYYARCVIFYSKGDNDKSIEEAEKCIKTKPDYFKPYYIIAACYERMGENDKALENYNRVVELNPGYATAYIKLGFCYTTMGRHDKAIENYNKAIELNPEDGGSYAYIGYCYRVMGEYDKAIKNFNKAIKLNFESDRTYANIAACYERMGEYAKAIKNLNKAIELGSKNALTYASNGFCYMAMGERDKAIKNLNKAIELDPKYVAAYVNIGFCYRVMGEYGKAIKNLNKAIELNPKYTTAYINIGRCYKAIGEYDKAIENFNKAIELNPEDYSAYNYLSWLHATCTNAVYRNGKKAVKMGTKAVELNCNLPTLNSLAAAYAETGEFDKAIETQEKAIEFNKSNRDVDRLDHNIKCLESFKAQKPWRDYLPSNHPLDHPIHDVPDAES